MAINFMADYHQENFFHGDIKPDNLFINDRFEMSSDAGTLLYLGRSDVIPSDKPLYIVNMFTPGYASFEHIDAIIKGEARSREQLMREDKHQLFVTLQLFLRIQKVKPTSPLCLKLLAYLKDDSLSVIAINKLLRGDVAL